MSQDLCTVFEGTCDSSKADIFGFDNTFWKVGCKQKANMAADTPLCIYVGTHTSQLDYNAFGLMM